MTKTKRRPRPRAESEIYDGLYVDQGGLGGDLNHLRRVRMVGHVVGGLDRLIGLYNTQQNTLVVPISFEEIYPEYPYEGEFRVSRAGKEGLFCLSSQTFRIPLEFEGFQRIGMDSGFYRVKKEKKYGIFFVSTQTLILPAEYYELDCDIPFVLGRLWGDDKYRHFKLELDGTIERVR